MTYNPEFFLIVGLALVIGSPANGQSSRAAAGLTLQGPAEPTGTVIKDALGRPCLDVEAVARPEVVNHEMLDHVVSIKNNCVRTVKVKLCYYNSQDCKQFDVQGYKRIDTILGTMKGINFFRYALYQR